jgi:hypothetical protein
MTDHLIEPAGLWAKTSGKTGRQYLTGRLGGLRVLISRTLTLARQNRRTS